jgi:hypothetical protein
MVKDSLRDVFENELCRLMQEYKEADWETY